MNSRQFLLLIINGIRFPNLQRRVFWVKESPSNRSQTCHSPRPRSLFPRSPSFFFFEMADKNTTEPQVCFSPASQSSFSRSRRAPRAARRRKCQANWSRNFFCASFCHFAFPRRPSTSIWRMASRSSRRTPTTWFPSSRNGASSAAAAAAA